jgi:hypothetical protein
MNSNEKWYSVSEVAHRYRVSCDTIRRRIKGGKLRALRLPKISPKRCRIFEVFMVSESELDRFERANMTF